MQKYLIGNMELWIEPEVKLYWWNPWTWLRCFYAPGYNVVRSRVGCDVVYLVAVCPSKRIAWKEVRRILDRATKAEGGGGW